jgi:hypothetical protein
MDLSFEELLKFAEELKSKKLEEQWKQNWDETIQFIETNSKRFGNESGWVVSPLWAPPLIGYILDPQRTLQEIDECLLEYYSADDNDFLKELFADIRKYHIPEFEKWYLLVDECIGAFEHGLFRPVIPSLITVIEGIPAIYAGNPKGKHTQTIKDYCLGMERRSNDIEFKIIWVSIKNYLDQLFAVDDFKEIRSQLINRHRVEHGRDDCPAWRKIDAIKLFVTVQALMWALNNYEAC